LEAEGNDGFGPIKISSQVKQFKFSLTLVFSCKKVYIKSKLNIFLQKKAITSSNVSQSHLRKEMVLTSHVTNTHTNMALMW